MLNPPEGEDQPQDLRTKVFVYDRPHPDVSEELPAISNINFDGQLGRMFLLPMDENGERKQATISDHVHTLDQVQASRENQLRFKHKVDGEQLDYLISYNQLMLQLEDTLDTGRTEDGLYKFKSIPD